MNGEPPRPYRGLRVLDAGQGIAAPYCGMLLAAAGADVIKLEPPEGDWSRGLSTRAEGQSVMHAAFNRGKRSLALDLKSDSGRAAAQALAARCDVLIEAFRPGVAARLGLGPEATREDAVCLSISGFGQKGPNAERPCTDSVAQAFSGLVALNQGVDGTPHKVGTYVSDVVTGLYAFAAVQAALAERAQDTAPRRRVLDISLLAGTAALIGFPIGEAGLLGRAPGALNIPSGSYQTACGAWVMIALVREAEFVALAGVLGRPDWTTDPRFASFGARAENRDAMLAEIRAVFATRDAAHWLAALHGARLMADRVNTPFDWLSHPHVRAIGGHAPVAQPELGEIPFPVLPGFGAWTRPAPALGQHSDEILAALRTEA